MLQSNKQAYIRGHKVAVMWKCRKMSVITWDQRCVSWAKNHKLPGWIGHIPVIFAVLISLAGIAAGGIAIVSAVILIWALAFILQHLGSNPAHSPNNYESDSSSPEVRAGSEGYGLYSGSDELTSYRMDKDYDE